MMFDNKDEAIVQLNSFFEQVKTSFRDGNNLCIQDSNFGVRGVVVYYSREVDFDVIEFSLVNDIGTYSMSIASDCNICISRFIGR